MERKVIYYKDELNDEFSEAKIVPRKIDGSYVYIHKNPLWNIASYILQNILSMPIKLIYAKCKLRIKYIGKENFKKARKTGYFIYANHTQSFADTFIPSLANYPKRNFFIVNPENVSMKFLKHTVEMLGALPIPSDKKGMVHFLEAIKNKISKNNSITIYPEAHIWPYYTKIRPFKDVSFKYPIKYNVPAFCITNTYQKGKKDKIKIVTYIDGPFFADKNLSIQEQKKDLRNQIYNCMGEQSKKSNVEYIKYIKEEQKWKKKLL